MSLELRLNLYVLPGVNVSIGDWIPSSTYPLLLPCPWYLWSSVLLATVTAISFITSECCATRVSYPPMEPLRTSKLYWGTVVPIPTELL